jgi:membrane protein
MRGLIARGRDLGHRLAETPVGRAFHRFNHFRGTRLAGTVTFYGFLSVFPILVLAFSIALRVVGTDGVASLEDFIEEYVPGIAEQLALQQVRQSASSLQIVGAATLLVTGLGWVDATRASVRSMWGLPDKHGSLVVRKLVDLLALAGLGLLVAVSLVASTWVSGEGERLLEWLEQDGSTVGLVASNVLAQVLASLTATALVAYVIAGLPRIRIPWRVLLPAALVGGVGLEILKRVLIGYISGFAGNNTYGAFGVPIALLVWIYVIARLLMVIAAWTAERCGAPLVQPRFLEAAAAMRAAGDDEAKQEEEWEAEHLAALPTASVAAGRESGRSVPAAATALGAGLLLGLVVGRRVGRRAGGGLRRGRR